MIKSALEFLLGLARPETVEIDGLTYSTRDLKRVIEPTVERLKIHSLSGLIEYIKKNPDELLEELLIVHVCSPTRVSLISTIRDDQERETFIDCDALLPRITFDQFHSTESFNIMLQSCFVQTPQTSAVLKVTGSIKDGTVRETGDDGVSQSVTVKAGIQRAADAVIPNPVILAPFRTFAEVCQPESKFVLRMKDGPQAGLFEADGGAWRIEAMGNIKAYLAEQLSGTGVKIIG